MMCSISAVAGCLRAARVSKPRCPFGPGKARRDIEGHENSGDSPEFSTERLYGCHDVQHQRGRGVLRAARGSVAAGVLLPRYIRRPNFVTMEEGFPCTACSSL